MTINGCIPMLSPRALTVPGIGGTWLAVRTKARAEKVLAADMLAARFDYFLPLVRSVDRWNRVTYSPPPVVRGIVFASCQAQPDDGYQVPTALYYFLKSHHAYAGMITVAPSAQRQFQSELEVLHSKINKGEINADTLADGLLGVVGELCRIRDGAYQGQETRIDSVLGKGWVEVTVDTFGRRTPLKIESRQLERIDRAAG